MIDSCGDVLFKDNITVIYQQDIGKKLGYRSLSVEIAIFLGFEGKFGGTVIPARAARQK